MVMDENAHSNIVCPPADPMALLLNAKLENIAAFDANHAKKLQEEYNAAVKLQEDLRMALTLQSQEDLAIANSEELAEDDFRVANETQQEEIRSIRAQEEEDMKVACQAQEEEEKAAMEMKEQLSKDAEIAKAMHEDYVRNVHGIIHRGDSGALQDLIEKGLDCSITSCEGAKHSLLQLAIRSQHVEIFKKLLANGASTDRTDAAGNTALHTAVELNRIAFIKLLQESNAKIDVKNKLGQTALTLAAKGGLTDAADLLLAAGAYIYHKDNQNKMPLQHVPFLSRALRAKLESMMGWALLDSARRGRGDKVSGLIERGASVFLSDEHNRTALHHAAHGGHTAVVEFLLKQKADPNAVDYAEKHTPLHRAAAAGALNVYQVLLQHGARADVRDAKGRLPAEMCGNAAKAAAMAAMDKAAYQP